MPVRRRSGRLRPRPEPAAQTQAATGLLESGPLGRREEAALPKPPTCSLESYPFLLYTSPALGQRTFLPGGGERRGPRSEGIVRRYSGSRLSAGASAQAGRAFGPKVREQAARGAAPGEPGRATAGMGARAGQVETRRSASRGGASPGAGAARASDRARARRGRGSRRSSRSAARGRRRQHVGGEHARARGRDRAPRASPARARSISARSIGVARLVGAVGAPRGGAARTAPRRGAPPCRTARATDRRSTAP